MNKKLGVLFSSAILLIIPIMVLAAPDPLTWINGILGRFLDIILWPLLIGVSLIMLVYAGLMFVIAHGDPSKITSARNAVIWAVVGIAVAILGYSAVATVRLIIGP